MTDDKHLEAILAKCRENLALAEKRAAGRWRNRFNHNSAFGPMHQVMSEAKDGCLWAINGLGGDMSPEDAAFIAACAGSAEAGWNLTIAVIESVPRANRGSHPALTGNERHLLDLIRAAWPKELL